jgi:hypothetical protein
VMTPQDIAKLLHDLRDDLIIRGNNIFSSSAVANDAFDRAMRTVARLDQDGSLAYLESLLNDDELSVRVFVASIWLFVDAVRAEQVLQEASVRTGPCAFSAGITLQEWRAGRMTMWWRDQLL